MKINQLTFEEYLRKVCSEKSKHPEWRLGQTYYNVLHEVRPDIAIDVNGVIWKDPYYNDQYIPRFLEYVESIWQT